MALSARGVAGGSDINVLVDPGATGDMQAVKLMAGVVASEEFIGSTDHGSTHALHVDPRDNLLSQSQNSAGLTTASTNYSNGDTLGSGWTFTSMARESGGSGVIRGIALIDKSDILSAATLYFSSASITFGTDNAAPSISDSDAENLGPQMPVAADDLGGVRLLAAQGLWLPYTCAATSLFVYARADTISNNFFGAATDLRLRLLYVPL
jgi:hypothetical protein